MKIFKIQLAALVLMLMSVSTFAANDVSRQGFYVGLGYGMSFYDSSEDEVFSDVIGGNAAHGWQLEGGYMWDIGRTGGWHLGVEGMYANRGPLGETAGGSSKFDFDVDVLAAMFVTDYEIASWVDLLLKVGVASVTYDAEATVYYPYVYNYSESDTSAGAIYSVGFAFYPTQRISVELAQQGMGFTSTDDTAYTSSTTSVSLRYQF